MTSPVLHELSSDSQKVLNENSSDDDDLPDVKFQDSFSSTPIISTNNKSPSSKCDKVSKNTTNTPITVIDSHQITGNYETVLNYKEKFVTINIKIYY